MEPSIRKYILEKIDPEMYVRQYIETMQSLLLRLMEEVNTKNLSSDVKQMMDSKIKEIILKGKDYSSPSERKNLITQAGGVVSEGLLPPEEGEYKSIYESVPGSVASNLEKAARDLRVSDITDASKTLLGKVKGVLFNKYSAMVAGALLVIAFAALWYKKYRETTATKRDIKNIIENDINPPVAKIASAIIYGKIRTESSLQDYMSDLNEAIVKKHFIKRNW